MNEFYAILHSQYECVFLLYDLKKCVIFDTLNIKNYQLTFDNLSTLLNDEPILYKKQHTHFERVIKTLINETHNGLKFIANI